ncbi:DNA ligase 1-like [Vespula squamosa]|uniref:DNA ligase 1-like n=1 Tax=Vespula squamosa TaxID=30214 RepID=A0ABD2BDU7_VESSQ
MPLYSRSNNCASKLVIVLQFTAWISVGIVLLQKGVTSLRSQSTIETKGDTQERNDATIRYLNDKTKRTADKDDISNDITKYKKDLTINLKLYQEKENDVSERHWNRRSNERNKVENNIMEDINDEHSITKKLNKLREEEKEEEKEKKEERERENDLINSSETSTQRDVYNSSYQSNKTEEYDKTVLDPSKTLSSTATSNNWGKEKKIRTRLNSGGAAAAIAMVAVGAAMLVVGPMVIVLRALDKRRQERRYLKSSRWDDQPPTYEQATLMNEVPRYSTLNLNTVHNSRVPSISSRPITTSFERSP